MRGAREGHKFFLLGDKAPDPRQSELTPVAKRVSIVGSDPDHGRNSIQCWLQRQPG